MELVWITALGVGSATIVGSIIGLMIKEITHKFSDIVLSFAAGIMLAASILGLILPSVDYGGRLGVLVTVAGIFVGAVCLNLIDKFVPHLHKLAGVDLEEHNNADINKVLLFVTAVAIHNLPEGIAAGVGFGSGDMSRALMIAGGIALQNIPEGMVINRAYACGRYICKAHFYMCGADGTDRDSRHFYRIFYRQRVRSDFAVCAGVCRRNNALRHK